MDRDRSKPCEHYTYLPHRKTVLLDLGALERGAYIGECGQWHCHEPECPGGAENA